MLGKVKRGQQWSHFTVHYNIFPWIKKSNSAIVPFNVAFLFKLFRNINHSSRFPKFTFRLHGLGSTLVLMTSLSFPFSGSELDFQRLPAASMRNSRVAKPTTPPPPGRRKIKNSKMILCKRGKSLSQSSILQLEIRKDIHHLCGCAGK